MEKKGLHKLAISGSSSGESKVSTDYHHGIYRPYYLRPANVQGLSTQNNIWKTLPKVKVSGKNVISFPRPKPLFPPKGTPGLEKVT